MGFLPASSSELRAVSPTHQRICRVRAGSELPPTHSTHTHSTHTFHFNNESGRKNSSTVIGTIPRSRKWEPTTVGSCLENPMDKAACGPQPVGPQRVGHDWATEHAHRTGVSVICKVKLQRGSDSHEWWLVEAAPWGVIVRIRLMKRGQRHCWTHSLHCVPSSGRVQAGSKLCGVKNPKFLWVQAKLRTYSFAPVILCQFHFSGLNGVSGVLFKKVQTSGKDGLFGASRIEIQYMIISSGRGRSVSVKKGKWLRQGVSQMGTRQPDQGAFSLLCRVALQLARGPVLWVCFGFVFLKLFFWSIVDLQCCVDFRSTAK